MPNNIAREIFRIQEGEQNLKVYDPAVTRGDLIRYDDLLPAGGGGGGSQNLQDVTDIGSTTTNPIVISDGALDEAVYGVKGGAGPKIQYIVNGSTIGEYTFPQETGIVSIKQFDIWRYSFTQTGGNNPVETEYNSPKINCLRNAAGDYTITTTVSGDFQGVGGLLFITPMVGVVSYGFTTRGTLFYYELLNLTDSGFDIYTYNSAGTKTDGILLDFPVHIMSVL